MNGCAKAHFVGKKLWQIGSFPPISFNFGLRLMLPKLNFVTEILLSNMFLLFRDRPTFGMLWHCQP